MNRTLCLSGRVLRGAGGRSVIRMRTVPTARFVSLVRIPAQRFSTVAQTLADAVLPVQGTAQQFLSSIQPFYSKGVDNRTRAALSYHLKALFPLQQHISIVDDAEEFDLQGFLKAEGHPPLVYEGAPVNFNQLTYDQHHVNSPEEPLAKLVQGALEFEYRGTRFMVFHAHDFAYFQYFVLFDGEDEFAGRDLVRAVYAWGNALRDEIWVFSQGAWMKDKAMYKGIQEANWDDLVLDEEVFGSLKTDTKTFFASRKIYESFNVPWKRGLIMHGPPGNGKTKTIQLILKGASDMGVGCIYVKSFHNNKGDEHGIRSIFQRARKASPCILVLEDLDSMVDDSVRSFFLNELDGLENNDGILTLATTNHPERIDDAILRRPSRFDKKYNFALPNFSLRHKFVLQWIRKIKQLGQIDFGGKDDQALAHIIASKTDDWSYAFLKELFVSFLLRSASDRVLANDSKQSAPLDVLLEQIRLLAGQVSRGRSPGFALRED